MKRFRRLAADLLPWAEDVAGMVALAFLAWAIFMAAGIMQP